MGAWVLRNRSGVAVVVRISKLALFLLVIFGVGVTLIDWLPQIWEKDVLSAIIFSSLVSYALLDITGKWFGWD